MANEECDEAICAHNTGVLGVDDGITMGHLRMCYSLPSRELTVDAVETMVIAHYSGALVWISDCGKSGLMAAVLTRILILFLLG